MGVVDTEHAGMASGVNATFRQIGIAVSIAVLGSLFAARLAGRSPATSATHYATALNTVLLVAACIAFAAAALALLLIRAKDFHRDRATTRSEARTCPPRS